MEAFRAGVVTWLPLIVAICNWIIVRYSKPDTIVPINISPRLRPWVPIFLGILVATLERFVVPGASFSDALRTAMIGGLGPILGHELITESMMNGREIPVPFMRPIAPLSAGGTGSMSAYREGMDADTGDLEAPRRSKGWLRGWWLTGPLGPVALIVVAIGCGIGSGLATEGCTPARTAASEKMGADAAVCLIDEYEKTPCAKLEDIVLRCVGVVVEDGAKVILAHKRGAHVAACPTASSSAGGAK